MKNILLLILNLALAPIYASELGQKVIAALEAGSFDNKKSLWSVTPLIDQSQIKILQVPFNSSQPQTQQTPASDYIDNYKNLIVSANTSVDISSLDAQNGKTLDSIRDGITELDKKQKPIIVRLIFGSIPFDTNRINAEAVLSYITQKLPKTSQLKVYVGVYRAGYTFNSWNHTKILSIDDNNLITGGINFIDSGYADPINPVNDLSLFYNNMNLGLPASKFLDNEWAYLCKYAKLSLSLFSYTISDSIQFARWEKGEFENNDCITSLASSYSFTNNQHFLSSPNSDSAISIGRLAAIEKWQQDAADTALLTMLNNAKSTIKISQQAVFWPLLSFVYQFPNEVLKSLCNALNRGVKIEIMTSGYKAEPGPIGQPKPNYSSFVTADQLINAMAGICPTTPNLYNKQYFDIRANYNKFDTNFDHTYVPNHSKVIIVDGADGGKLTYVGSQNTYDASHAEYGVIIDSKDFADRFETEFWNYNWQYSK